MPQAIQVETQSEQQGVAPLRAQRTSRRMSGRRALHRAEQNLDQGTAPIELLRERPPHIGTHSTDTPVFFSGRRRNHAPRPELLSDLGVIAVTVEFSVGQHQPAACLLGSRSDDRQIRAVVPRAAPRELRQHEVLIQIDRDHPLQPVPPRQRFVPVMMHAPHNECADDCLRQARRIDRHADPPPSFSPPGEQPAQRLADGAINRLVVHTLQEAIRSCEVGHSHEPECLSSFAMFAQPHVGIAEAAVFVTDQAENGQSLPGSSPRRLRSRWQTAVAEHRRLQAGTDGRSGAKRDGRARRRRRQGQHPRHIAGLVARRSVGQTRAAASAGRAACVAFELAKAGGMFTVRQGWAAGRQGRRVLGRARTMVAGCGRRAGRLAMFFRWRIVEPWHGGEERHGMGSQQDRHRRKKCGTAGGARFGSLALQQPARNAGAHLSFHPFVQHVAQLPAQIGDAVQTRHFKRFQACLRTGQQIIQRRTRVLHDHTSQACDGNFRSL